MDPDLAVLLSTNLTKPIDLTKVNHILARPPFLAVPGSFNVRDLGYGTMNAVKEGYILRAGSLENITAAGQAILQDFGITTIFDLRSEREKELAPTPDIPLIDNRWFPSTSTNTTTVAAQKHAEPAKSFTLTSMYLDLLETHKPSYKAVFEHIRDHPDRSFLFHCTAGKDRTGLLAALILAIANVEIEQVNYDYALTRVGIEPVRDMLMAKLLAGNFNVDMNSPRMREYNRMPLDCWTDVFNEMNERYGGVEGYIRDELGLSDNDIVKVKNNLKE